MRLGVAIGRSEAARAYLAKLDGAMAAIEKPKTKPGILPLQRRNLTAAPGILWMILSAAPAALI